MYAKLSRERLLPFESLPSCNTAWAAGIRRDGFCPAALILELSKYAAHYTGEITLIPARTPPGLC